MVKNTRVMSYDVLLEEYRQLLQDESIQVLPLVISGNSMSPFLVHGRDTIYLSRLDRPVKKGDVLLYKRDSGAYILHRVYKVEENGFTMVGDAQAALEKGIRTDQIIAVMTSALRKGKVQKPGCFWWEFFEKVWPWFVPVRPAIIKIYTFITGNK
ncbi:MAG: S24/S26 family peptidase [Oscillospiraceae bacterium]|nr:S24/S26 family peptidase [Oscillospiraceae bacterium]